MEEAQNWMLTWKRHEFLKPHFQASINSLSDSWEEKAFAEDSSGFFGGFSWPPRSYSCSFCSKEFSSAQALGGHMNVHRRDRAKLKQSLSQKNNQVVLDHQIQNQDPDDEPKFPLESAGFDHNDYSTSLGSRLSGLSTHENFTTSSIVEEELKGQLFASDSTSKRALNSNIISSERNPEAEMSIKLAGGDSMCLGFDDDDHDHVETNSKRPKIAAASTLQFFVSEKKYNSPDLQWRQEIPGLKKPATADSMEDLDLELKLGILE